MRKIPLPRFEALGQTRVETEGAAAYMAGEKESDNPYKRASTEWCWWDNAFQQEKSHWEEQA